jgi:hypothetical protein
MVFLEDVRQIGRTGIGAVCNFGKFGPFDTGEFYVTASEKCNFFPLK